MRAQFVVSETLTGIRRNVTMVLSVILAVAVSLALGGVALLAHDEVVQLKGYWYDKVQVAVYLCTDYTTSAQCSSATTEAQKAQIRQTLEQLPQVQRIYYESQQEAYTHFKEVEKDQPALVQNTTPGAIPDSFRVKLSNPDQADVVASALDGAQGVNYVYDQHKAFAKLFGLLNRLQSLGLWFAVITMVAAVLMIVNTTRLAFFSRRREVGIMRLVGASSIYIQLPFLLEGIIGGIVGALIGWGGTAALKIVLFDWLHQQYAFQTFGWDAVLRLLPLLVGVGVVFSSFASWVTLRRYLRV